MLVSVMIKASQSLLQKMTKIILDKLRMLIFWGLIALPSIALSGYEEGIAALNRGDKFNAASNMRDAYMSGDVRARTLYGVMLFGGEGFSRDEGRGLALIKESVAAKDPTALYWLGVASLKGAGANGLIPKNEQLAIDLLKEAASLGNTAAKDLLTKISTQQEERAARARQVEQNVSDLKELARKAKEKFGEQGFDANFEPNRARKKCFELAREIRTKYRPNVDLRQRYEGVFDRERTESCVQVKGTAAYSFALLLNTARSGNLEEAQRQYNQLMQQQSFGLAALEKDWGMSEAEPAANAFLQYVKELKKESDTEEAKLKAFASRLTYAELKQGMANVLQIQKSAANSAYESCRNLSKMIPVHTLQQEFQQFSGFKDTDTDPSTKMAQLYRRMRSVAEKTPQACIG